MSQPLQHGATQQKKLPTFYRSKRCIIYSVYNDDFSDRSISWLDTDTEGSDKDSGGFKDNYDKYKNKLSLKISAFIFTLFQSVA